MPAGTLGPVSDAPRLRFAPSPTGYLHVGGARAALFNWLIARRTGGEFLLRIEDTDRERNRPELTENILDALRWLGLDWDGEVVYQADHLDEHAAGARTLLDDGRAYWCDCTAEDVDARRTEKGATGYDGHCRERGLDGGPGAALRFRAPDDGETTFTDVIRGEVRFDNATIEDFVLLRSSGLPVFLLSNAMDDARMGITHVVRGEDHVNGTPKYLLLRDALGLGRPEVIAHLPLLVNESRKKLSKRRDSVAVGDFRDRGFLPEAMMNYLALLGWGPKDDVEIRPMGEIIDQFRLEDVNPAPAFFDEKKLEHFNAEYIRELSDAEFLARVTPFLADADRSLPFIERFVEDVKVRTRLLPEAEDWVDFLANDVPNVDEKAWAKVMAKDPAATSATLSSIIELIGDVEWSEDALEHWFRAHAEREGLGLGKVIAPVRVAVTGRTASLPIFGPLAALGKEETVRRLRTALDTLAE